MKGFNRGVICAFLIMLAPMPIASAADDWRDILRRAENADIRHEYAVAARDYKTALERMPANEENTRAKTLALLAEVNFALGQYEAASANGKKSVDLAKQLKARNKLEAEVLENIELLNDSCRQIAADGLPLGTPNHDRVLVSISSLENAVGEILVERKGASVSDQLKAARKCASEGKFKQAETHLRKLLQSSKLESADARRIRLYIAAVQTKQGNPEAINKLLQEWKYSPSKAWRHVGEAKFWIYDVDGALEAYKHALSLLPKQNSDWREEGTINSGIATMNSYNQNFKAAEPYWRRNVQLYSKHPEATQLLKDSRNILANFLRRLNRSEEAAQVFPKKKPIDSEMEWLLNDEEREALAKRKNRS